MSQPIPRDARIVALIASSMGIQDFEPAVLIQLLDFAHRHAYDVLQDAIMYADHASASTKGAPSSVTIDDLQLAVQSRVNYSFTQPPTKEMLLSLATSINTVPLPPISDGYGVRLPPRSQRLTNVNFNIVPNAPPPADLEDDDAEEEEDKGKLSTNGTTNTAQKEQSSRQMDEDDEYDDNDIDAVDAGAADKQETNPSAPAGAEQRGEKRKLEEDEDYD